MLLESNGVAVGDGSMTPHLETELRKLRRKYKNKMSAKDCRRRRKAYVSDLEGKSSTLENHVSALVAENKHLLAQVRALQALVGQQGAVPQGSRTQASQAQLSSAQTQEAPSRMCAIVMMMLVLSNTQTQPGSGMLSLVHSFIAFLASTCWR